jgi:hypothetical protein
MKNKIIEALQNKYKQLGLSAKAIEGAATFLEPSVKEESEIEAAVAAVEPILKALQSEADTIRTAASTAAQTAKAEADKKAAELEAKIKALGGDATLQTGAGDDIDAKIATKLAELVKPLQDKVNAYEAKETASARATLITTKAKELGLPDFMIKHGFVIPEDADEAAIGATLAAIKQDYVTAGLPNGNHFPIVSGDKATKEDADRIVANMNV